MDAVPLLNLPDVGKALGSIPSMDRNNKIESRHYSRPPEAEPASALDEGVST